MSVITSPRMVANSHRRCVRGIIVGANHPILVDYDSHLVLSAIDIDQASLTPEMDTTTIARLIVPLRRTTIAADNFDIANGIKDQIFSRNQQNQKDRRDAYMSQHVPMGAGLTPVYAHDNPEVPVLKGEKYIAGFLLPNPESLNSNGKVISSITSLFTMKNEHGQLSAGVLLNRTTAQRMVTVGVRLPKAADYPKGLSMSDIPPAFLFEGSDRTGNIESMPPGIFVHRL